MNGIPGWKQYQEDVAALLSEFGFIVTTDERISGARGEHAIDVAARMRVAGIDQLWVVECKDWKRAIPKERALTFLGIVADIGADRGLMFSESGFQAGAIRTVSRTNITLTNLEDFKQNSADELASLRIRSLDANIERLSQQYLSIWDLVAEDRAAILARYSGPSGMIGRPDPTAVQSRLSVLRHALEEARYSQWPVSYWPLDDDQPIFVENWDILKFLVEETLATCTRIFDHMMSPESQVDDWKELQSPRLTEVLERIRTPRREPLS